MKHCRFLLALALLTCIITSSSVGSTTHKWQGYFQVCYTNPEDRADYLSLRRLKLYGGGPISGNWSYYLQFLYKTNNRSSTDNQIVVQEASASTQSGSVKLTVGQFKPPFGMERFTSDSVLALIDRSQPTDKLVPNGSLGMSFARDRGIQIERKIGKVGRCAVGVFDGNGANEPLEGNGPLVVGRFIYEPCSAAKRFHSELAVSWRKDHDIDFTGQLPGAPPGYANFSGNDVRQNIAIAYDFGKNSLRCEYFAARYHSNKSAIPSIDAQGYYLQWAYAVSRKWLLAARLEAMDPDRSVVNSKDISWLTIGATYYIKSDYHKIQVNYIFKSEKAGEINNDAIVAQYQRFF
ncbi:MAG: porin [Armatimonadota bacterium]|nr:porin [Armatimonadota bacterium]